VRRPPVVKQIRGGRVSEDAIYIANGLVDYNVRIAGRLPQPFSSLGVPAMFGALKL